MKEQINGQKNACGIISEGTQASIRAGIRAENRAGTQVRTQASTRRKAPLSLLIKPASGLCNLRCDYCFYREEVAHLQDFHQKIMSDETMDLLIQRAFESAGGQVQFTFQGGEPTMAGLEFFERFTERVESTRRRKKKLQVGYAFQTNGILLDKNWTALFRNYHFLVGLSFDGTERLHDRYRVGVNGEKTAARVQAAWELLCEEKVDTNLLCVVTGPMARNPEKVYRYLRRMGAGFWQFIPCMGPAEDMPVAVAAAVETPPSVKKTLNSGDPVGASPTVRSASHSDAPVDASPIRGNASNSDGSVKVPSATLRSPDWTLEPKDYAYFLKGMFDLWYQDWKRGHYVSIRNFDDYIHLLCGRNASTCAACGDCGGYLAVEHDGSVYPCDFYVEDRWCLGNIHDSSMDELRYGNKMQEFLDETRQFHQNSHRCEACEFYRLCRGGCKHDGKRVTGRYQTAIEEEKNIFCEAFQDFFRYAMPRMVEIAQAEMRYLE